MNQRSGKGASGAKDSAAKSSAARDSATTVVILAAGLGKRMKSPRPKVLNSLCGRPMIAWVIDQAMALDPARILVVVGHGAEDVEKSLAGRSEHASVRERIAFVRQQPQLGTGHALQCCLSELAPKGRVVVLYGDMPLLSKESLVLLARAHDEDAAGGVALLTGYPDEPRGFGRIVRAEEGGGVRAIVEERDASPEVRAIGEVNLGVYAFDAAALVEALPKLTNDNAQKEYYLTDVIGRFVEAGRPAVAVELDDATEGIGVNTLADLAEARWALQVRILEEHLMNGVAIEDPATTYIDWGVEIGTGTKILPCTVIKSGVKIGGHCEVGPFTHLRAGTVLADHAEVGNFTECKNARVGSHAKAKHLSYLGDVTIGARTNIGAGTIFANYDGRAKHPSTVGDDAFVGSGTVIVAPNTIGDGATTGAGAVVTRDAGVGAQEVWVGVPAKKLARRSAPGGSAGAARRGEKHS
ncbi:MAG: bifunctional N-acetylglucosamine-1-phosphate uridyltransferase/glucosamine-1-phosphate acetyltransferase [Planctomycetota bacterium]